MGRFRSRVGCSRIFLGRARRLGAILLVFVLAGALYGCKDHGDFEVAERHRVDDADFPNLEDLDLRNAVRGVTIGSELHARLLPEAPWPGPLSGFLDLLKRHSNGTLPTSFDLPVPDACIYVSQASGASPLVRRVDGARGPVLLISGSRVVRLPNRWGRVVLPTLQIIDERSMALLEPVDVRGRILDAFEVEGRLALLEADASRLFIRWLTTDREGLLVGPSRHLYTFGDPPLRSSRPKSAMDNSGRLHIAWVDRADEAERDAPLVHVAIDLATGEASARTEITGDHRTWTVETDPVSGQVVLVWVDSRFQTGAFSPKNTGKVFLQVVSGQEAFRQPPLVINEPYEDSDSVGCGPWVFPSPHGLIVGWQASVCGDPNDRLELALIDMELRTASLRASGEVRAELEALATDQHLLVQRNLPVPGHPRPADVECAKWQEFVDSSPFGVLDPATGKVKRVLYWDPSELDEN